MKKSKILYSIFSFFLALLFFLLFFIFLIAITALLILILSILGLTESFAVSKILIYALSFFSRIRDGGLILFAISAVYSLSFFTAAFVIDRISENNACIKNYTYRISGFLFAVYTVYLIVLTCLGDANWRQCVPYGIVSICAFNRGF